MKSVPQRGSVWLEVRELLMSSQEPHATA